MRTTTAHDAQTKDNAMDNFQRYEAFAPEARMEPAQETGVRINVYDTVQRVSTLDGVMTDNSPWSLTRAFVMDRFSAPRVTSVSVM